MKGIVYGLAWILLVGLFVSCASAPTTAKLYRPLEQGTNAEVIGTVQTKFESIGGGMNKNKQILDMINGAAYSALLDAAKQEYGGNIDIYDILWTQVRVIKSAATYVNMVVEYTASGKVISYEVANRRSTDAIIEGALAHAAEEVSENFTARSMIAIVYIAAQDKSTTDFITGELEHILRKQGFVIIDRSELDKVRREQNFQMAGEVDDSTAVSIGKFAGANIIVTGRVDGEGSLRRLRLRALETTSAQIVGTASERL